MTEKNRLAPTALADPLANVIVPIVTVTVIDERGHILLFKREKRGQLFENYWEVVGGRIEFGETSAEAARRELEEEAGISGEPEFVTVLEHVGRRSPFAPSSYHRIMFVYLVTVHEVRVVKSEHRHYRWLSPEGLPGRIIPFNKEAIYRSLAHVERHPPGQQPLFPEYAFERRLTLLRRSDEEPEEIDDAERQYYLFS